MAERRRIVTLVLVMALVASGVGGAALWSLYRLELKQQAEYLQALARTQVEFIERSVDFEAIYHGEDDPQEVVRLIRNCYLEFPGFGTTGEVVIARRVGDEMEFIVHRRRNEKGAVPRMPFASSNAEPVRRALLGQRGVMEFYDCRQVESLGAYEPINRAGLALLTKISLDEVRQPFIRTTEQLAVVGGVLILVGSTLFWWITRPLLRQLQSKELRYRTLFENTADGVFLMRGKSIVETNGQGCVLLGCDEENIINRSPVTFSPEFQPDGRSSLAVAQHYIHSCMTLGPQSFTWQYLRQGQLREADVVLQSLQLDGDSVVLATMRDVTDIKETERSLRERERHYRAIFERGSNGFLLYRRNGQLVDANPAACRMYGYEFDELLSLTTSERLHREDCERYLNCVARTIDREQGCHLELRGLNRNGRLIYFEVFLEPFLWCGDVLCLATAIDVSERKEAEKAAQCEEARMEALLALQQMMEQSEAQIGRYILNQALKVSGSDQGALAVRCAAGELAVLSSTLEQGRDWFAAQLQRVQCCRARVVNHPHDDWLDHGLNFQRYMQVPLLEDGEIVAVICLVNKEDGYTDFDMRQQQLLLQGTWQRLQRNRSLEALRVAKEEAEEANRAKSEFLAIVSHEIRTPMTVTMAALQQVLEMPLEPLQQQYLTMANDASTSLLQLINDILDFSKIEARKLVLEQMPFSMRECAENVVNILGVNARQKGLALDLRCDPDLPAILLGDQHRLRQVLVNLVGNAIKFTDEGQVLIEVEARPGRDDICELQVAVCDTGIGIDEQQSAELFECFSQGDSSTTRKYGGTGLGLAICKGLVEQMGGQIGIENRPQQGSCFKFNVPLRRLPRATAVGDCDAIEEQEESLALALAGMKVLLAEDEPAAATLIQAMLEGYGLVVELVDQGGLAVRRCCEKSYDLVLMDYQMPHTDGLTATTRIRAAGLNVPIVGLTAHGGDRERHTFIAAGMNDCLAKPVDKTVLREVLLRYAPHQRVRRL